MDTDASTGWLRREGTVVWTFVERRSRWRAAVGAGRAGAVAPVKIMVGSASLVMMVNALYE